jgi:hypothetical protein
VQAPLGNDTFAIKIFDGANATGNLLGTASATATIAPSGSSVTATVDAIVGSYTLSLSPATLAPGTNTATLSVIAKDVDGNVITGPGNFANPITIANGDKGSAFTLSSPTIAGPGQSITVTHNSAGGCANATVLTAATSGAPSQTLTLSATGTSLYVANDGGGNVLEFASPYMSAPITLYSLTSPLSVAFDPQANLFVSSPDDVGGYVQENIPPSTIIGSGQFASPRGIVTDNNGNLFAADGGNNTVFESAPPHTAAASAPITTGLNTPAGIALDSRCNLFVDDATAIREYAPPYTGAPTATITTGLNAPRGMIFDGADNLFVANYGANNVVEYAPPYTGAPAATIALPAGSNPSDVAFDPTGNLVVAERTSSQIVSLAPPFTGSPIQTITSGLLRPSGVRFGPRVVAPSALNLYTTELGNDSLTVTPSNGNGNVAPTRTLVGANTAINQPYDVAVDGSGISYLSGLRNATITVYAAGANGNVAPIRTINGASTTLNGPLGLAIDGSGDLIADNFFVNTVTVFAPGANGNVAPIRTISGANTGLAEVYGLTLDTGGNLYVVNNASQFGGIDSVTVYPPGANGNVFPTRTIMGGATGMSGAVFDAVDAAGNLYVANTTANSITIYAPGANGNVAPTATIAGSNTGLVGPAGIVLDSSGNIYVANDRGNSIVVFAAGASGNATPLRTIVGAATGITAPDGIKLAP